MSKNTEVTKKEERTFKTPSVGRAALALLCIFIPLLVGLMILKGAISIHSALMIGLCLVCTVSLGLGYKFDDLLKFIGISVKNSIFGLLFFFAIGALVASWMVAGTVPAIIYYGTAIITPGIFLPVGLILASITAYCTGTSWGTIGTIGIALVGIGQGMGIPLPVIAGMVVSGACFGDKMSTVSDTPNLAAISSGANLYKTIKALFQTMIPAYIITLIVYTVIGLQYADSTANMAEIEATRSVLAANFNMNPLVITPLILLIVFNLKKFPALPAMVITTAYSIILAILLQGANAAVAIETINSGFKIETESAFVNTILNRGGLQSMLWTQSVALLGISIGGVLDHCGYLKVLVTAIMKRVKSVFGLAAAVMGTALLATASLGDTYLSLILTGTIYKKEFDRVGIDRAILARWVSDGGHIMAPLMVWTTFGAYAAGALGIQPSEYWMYAVLCFTVPLVSLLMTFFGLAISWNNPKNKGVRKLADADLSNEPIHDEE